MKKCLLAAFLHLTFAFALHAQKEFTVLISFPTAIDFEKLRLEVDGGFGRVPVEYAKRNSEVELTGKYQSKYAAIIVRYPDGKNKAYRKIFFLKNKKARIDFAKNADGTFNFDKYKLTNAYDFASEKIKLDNYVAKEVAKAEEFFNKYRKEMFEENNQELNKTFYKLEHDIYLKSIEYVKSNNDSYYSFWDFKSNAGFSGLSVDSILKTFDTTFPEKIKNSTEGKIYRNLLVGKLNQKIGSQAPQFVSKDLNGKVIDLYSFRDKKYVLLSFWATWCGPCIEEMPLLKSLHSKYADDLEVISVAYPTHIAEVKKVLHEQEATWTNIYNDMELINNYGGMRAIPIVLLIDKAGKIVYYNQEDKDGDLSKLFETLEKRLAH